MVRLDDGTELMVKTFSSPGPEFDLSRRCTKIINAAVLGEALPADLLPVDGEAAEVFELRSEARQPPRQEAPVKPPSSEDSDWIRDDGSDDWD